MTPVTDQQFAARERQTYGCSCNVEDELTRFGRPLHLGAKPAGPIRPASGAPSARSWDAEAAKRMLAINLDPRVSVDWENLVVYGGSGRAARNWHDYHTIQQTLERLAPDETLCIQSGRAVYVARTHEQAPRVLIANSNLVPRCFASRASRSASSSASARPRAWKPSEPGNPARW